MDEPSAREADEVVPDGLVIPEIGYWAEDKYDLVERYATMMATAMKDKWSELIYLDLYCGAGYAQIRETSRLVKTLPLRVLGIRDPFSRYVFCDADAEQIEALKERSASHAPGRKCFFEVGDANEVLGRVLAHVPAASRAHTVLTLCVLDPFNSESLRFQTIETVVRRLLVDFVVLVPTGMDLARAEKHYLRGDNTRIADFTGDPDWRAKWKPTARKLDLGMFVLQTLSESMTDRLSYQTGAHFDAQAVRGGHTRRRLYHLAFFSRNPRGSDLWKKAVKSLRSQTALHFD